MEFDEAVLLAPGCEIAIPAGQAGLDFIGRLPTHVAPRRNGRTNSQRERKCIVEFIRHVAKLFPSLFPAKLTKVAFGGSPDFLLVPEGQQRSIGIEHTDAGGKDFHAWMDAKAEFRATTTDFDPAEPGRLENEPDWAWDERDAERSKPTQWSDVFPDSCVGRFALTGSNAPASAADVTGVPSPMGQGWIDYAPERAFADALKQSVEKKSQANRWRQVPGAARCVLIYDNTNTGGRVGEKAAQQALDWAAATALQEGLHCVALIRCSKPVLLAGSLL